MTHAGIDYGMGRTNIDHKTGIRYGIIHSNHEALVSWLWDMVENEYDPHCPGCGNELDEDFDSPGQCPDCGCDIRDGEEFGDDPSRTVFDHEDCKGFIDSHGDIWVCWSLWTTTGVYCSPCAPGAVTITADCPEGPEAYCLPPDWFEGGRMPYRASERQIT